MTKHERYNRSPLGKARSDRYRATPAGRRARLREDIRRREATIQRIEKELS